MAKKSLKEQYHFILTTIYNKDPQELANKTETELAQMLEQAQQQLQAKTTNPNKFWLYKGVEPPKLTTPKTSAKAGVWVIVAFFGVLLLAGIIFMILAFVNNS